MKKLSYLVIALFCVAVAAPVHAQKLKDAFIDIKEKTLRKEYSHLAMMPVVASSSAQFWSGSPSAAIVLFFYL